MCDEQSAEKISSYQRLQIYQHYAELTRKWIAVMDAKAAFISTISGALLAFLWAFAKTMDGALYTMIFGGLTTVAALVALAAALWTVIPRGYKPSKTPGPNIQSVSFYGFVSATHSSYPAYRAQVESLSTENLLDEALLQHYSISSIASKKEKFARSAGFSLIIAIVLCGVTLALKLANQ